MRKILSWPISAQTGVVEVMRPRGARAPSNISLSMDITFAFFFFSISHNELLICIFVMNPVRPMGSLALSHFILSYAQKSVTHCRPRAHPTSPHQHHAHRTILHCITIQNLMCIREHVCRQQAKRIINSISTTFYIYNMRCVPLLDGGYIVVTVVMLFEGCSAVNRDMNGFA